MLLRTPLRVGAHPVPDEPDEQPYTFLLYRELRRAGVDVFDLDDGWSPWRPPDVVHLHWPDHLLLRRSWRRYVRPVQLLVRMAVARRRGAVVVLTVHNAEPHDIPLGRFGRWYLRRFDRLVDRVLVLAEAGRDEIAAHRPGLADTPVSHTRHGEFASAYPTPPDRRAARARFGIDPERPTIVFAGQVRPYKGVPELLAAASTADADVLVVGECTDEGLRAELETAAERDPRIHLVLAFVPGDELVAAVAAATVVALPYRRVLNSGAALLALSSNRAVLVPDTPTFRELGREVGAEWVHLFPPSGLTDASIRDALAAAPAEGPDLRAHQWPAVAAATIEAYLEAVRRRHPDRRGG